MLSENLVEIQELKSLAANRRQKRKFRRAIDEWGKSLRPRRKCFRAHVQIRRILIGIKFIEPDRVRLNGIVMKHIETRASLTLGCFDAGLDSLGHRLALALFDFEFYDYCYLRHYFSFGVNYETNSSRVDF